MTTILKLNLFIELGSQSQEIAADRHNRNIYVKSRVFFRYNLEAHFC